MALAPMPSGWRAAARIRSQKRISYARGSWPMSRGLKSSMVPTTPQGLRPSLHSLRLQAVVGPPPPRSRAASRRPPRSCRCGRSSCAGSSRAGGLVSMGLVVAHKTRDGVGGGRGGGSRRPRNAGRPAFRAAGRPAPQGAGERCQWVARCAHALSTATRGSVFFQMGPAWQAFGEEDRAAGRAGVTHQKGAAACLFEERWSGCMGSWLVAAHHKVGAPIVLAHLAQPKTTRTMPAWMRPLSTRTEDGVGLLRPTP